MPSCRAEVLAGPAPGTAGAGHADVAGARLVPDVLLRRTGACSDCGGCGGRCNLFLSDEAAMLRLPASAFATPPVAGTAVTLVLEEGWLLRSAWRGYGLPLLGLLAGAAAGHGLASALGLAPDLPALLLALLGTFAAFRFSKDMEPHIAVQAVDPATAGAEGA